MKKLFITTILLTMMTVFSFGETVTLFWDANSEPNVTHYDVFRSDVTGGQYSSVGAVVQGANPFFTDLSVDLSAGDKFYVVRAVNNEGLSSVDSNEVSASGAPVGTPPGAPTITITVTVSP